MLGMHVGLRWSVKSMKVRKEDQNGWKLEAKIRQAVGRRGVRVQYMSIKNQRSEVRKNDPNGVMSEDRGGDRKGKSDLMKGRGQR